MIVTSSVAVIVVVPAAATATRPAKAKERILNIRFLKLGLRVAGTRLSR